MRSTNSGLATLVVLALVGPAAAQTPRVEVSGGYQATRVPDQTLPLGWNADVAINLDDIWAVVGEVGGAYRTVNDGNLGVDVDLSIHTLAFGGRWSTRRAGRIFPFLQFLGGIERHSASAQVLQTKLGDSRSRFMLQPGGGVNVKVNDSLGIVGQVDYRRIFLDDEEDGKSGENQFRIVAGLRLAF